MASIKQKRLAEQLREKISQVVLTELKDPRHGFITVTNVEPSSDMASARVFVSILGSEAQQTKGLKALEAARGYIQQRIGRTLKTRNTPVLKFILDKGIKESFKISQLLKDVLPGEEAEAEPEQNSGGTPPDSETENQEPA